MSRSFRDLLLHLVASPFPTPGWALESSADLARKWGARVSCALVQPVIPSVSNWVADRLVHANEAIANANVRNSEACSALLDQVSETISSDVRGDRVTLPGGPVPNPDALVRLARTHDLSIVPVAPNLDYQLAAEALIFESARPVLLLPSAMKSARKIVVAWDGGRPAARAVGDALPLLGDADNVRLVSIAGEQGKTLQPLSTLQSFLGRHGIPAECEEICSKAQDVGCFLMEHAAEGGADLLVMGAYGHSRTRQFILGGVTRSVLHHPKLPIFLSH